jgi:hypothetical protein
MLAALAARLSGMPIRDIAPGAVGGNNRIYRVEGVAERFALKCYPHLVGDTRDRLGTEFTALEFLGRHGVTEVPRTVAADRAAGVALYSWVEGNPIGAVGAADIDAVLAFVARLAGLAQVGGELPLASEACLSGAELVRQVERRLARLTEIAIGRPELAALLKDGVVPALARSVARARAALDLTVDLAPARRTLSASDFGFHNSLRTTNGELCFVDFEYFGWDDPVKLVADFLLHPGMTLGADDRQRFFEGARAVFAIDAAFIIRFEMLYPLYALRWCLIILNEFLPERWSRRVFAGAGDRTEAEQRQLTKAQRLLEAMQVSNGDFLFAQGSDVERAVLKTEAEPLPR